MRRYRLRTSAVVLVTIFLFGTGVIGIRAAPTCQRLIKKYSEKITRHPITKATLSRWALWNQAHPNYHPPLKRHPRLTPQETLEKVNFACEVPSEQVETAGLLIPDLIPQLPPFPDFDLPNVTIPSTDLVPPDTPVVSLVSIPIINGPIITLETTPEPSSIVFLGTGLAVLVWMTRKTGWWTRSGIAQTVEN